jgi:hypothetical protein
LHVLICLELFASFRRICLHALTATQGVRPTAQEAKVMEAKYNWIIDSTPIRIAINTVAFAAWFGAVFGLMFFSVKV